MSTRYSGRYVFVFMGIIGPLSQKLYAKTCPLNRCGPNTAHFSVESLCESLVDHRAKIGVTFMLLNLRDLYMKSCALHTITCHI